MLSGRLLWLLFRLLNSLFLGCLFNYASSQQVKITRLSLLPSMPGHSTSRLHSLKWLVKSSLISQDFWYRSMASFGVSILIPMWGRMVLYVTRYAWYQVFSSSR